MKNKKTILKKSLFSMFLQRIEKLPFDLRGKHINSLDSKLQNDLLLANFLSSS
jgi:hypothetical protein